MNIRTNDQPGYGILEDEWLLSYAAGTLHEGEALMVASHAAYHPALQTRMNDAENLGGALLDDLQPASIQDDAFDNLMAMLDDELNDENGSEGGRIEIAPTKSRDSHLPAVLQDYLGKDLDALNWRTMGPGMKQVRLWEGPDGEKLWLLKARGGTTVPVHDHRGNEMTLVLTGSYHVGDDRYTPGMLEFADTEVEDHQPVIDDGEDCICLVVTNAPIRLHSLMARMAQPFIGL